MIPWVRLVLIFVSLYSRPSFASDIRHLNLAFHLEHFLTAFFQHGLSKYSDKDFIRAGYPDWVRPRYVQVLEHKKTHKEFLESALTAAGSELVKPCTFELCVPWFPVMFSSAYTY